MKTFSLAAIASLTLLITISLFAEPSLARKVNNATASNLMSQCLLADDNKTALGSSKPQKVACCSRSLGYCVVCLTSGAGKCDKVSYSARPASLLKPVAPNAGQLAPNTTAPTKPSRRPFLRHNNRTPLRAN